MEKKKSDIQFLWFLSLSSFSVLILYPAGQYVSLFPIISSIFLLLGGSSFIRKQYFFIHLFIVAVLTFLILSIRISASIRAGVPLDCINEITGYVIYDSSFTESKNHFMTIYMFKAGTTYGQTVSAGGLVNVIGDERAIITSGIKITLYGRFSDTLFKYESLQVLSRSPINDLREYLICEIEKRMTGGVFSQASQLSLMLILGRAETGTGVIKTHAQACGCSHILALSGMHLNTLNLVFKPVKNSAARYFLSLIVSALFVFVAGPRPSLVRAFLMLLLSFLPTTERLVSVFFLQAVIFPFSIVNIGCIYSYLSIYALVFLSPLIAQTGFVFRLVSASSSVVFLIAPIGLISDGFWNPLTVIISPIAGFLVLISMFSGFLLLAFGTQPFICKINEVSFDLLSGFLEYFSEFPQSGWVGYIVFASVFLALILSLPVSKLLLKHRFKKRRKKNFQNFLL